MWLGASERARKIECKKPLKRNEYGEDGAGGGKRADEGD